MNPDDGPVVHSHHVQLHGHSDDVRAVAFGAGDRVIVSASQDRTVRVWRFEAPAAIALPPMLPPALPRPASRGGSRPSSRGSVGLGLGRAGSGAPLARAGKGLLAAAVARGGAGAMGALRPPPTPQSCLFTFRGGKGDPNPHTGPVTCLHCVGDLIVSGSWDATVRVWNATTGRWLRTFTGHSGPVLSLVGQEGGGLLLLSSSADGSVRLWDLAEAAAESLVTGGGLTKLPAGEGGARKKAPAVEDIIAGRGDAAAGAAFVRKFCGHHHWVRCVRAWQLGAAPEQERIVTGSDDGTLCIWSQEPRALNASGVPSPLHVLRGHGGAVVSVELAGSGAGAMIASGARDGSVRVWDLASGDVVHSFFGHSGAVLCVAMADTLDLASHEGESQRQRKAAATERRGILVSASADQTLRVWSLKDGCCEMTLRAHVGAVNDVKTAKLGPATVLVSGGDDGVLYVWSAKTGRMLQTMRGHRGKVTCIRISHDNHVVSGATDKSVRVWAINASG